MISILFKRFREIYGSAWLHGVEVRDIPGVESAWKTALKNITMEQIKEAVRLILDAKTEFLAFPPNAIQFRKLCLDEAIQAPYHAPAQLEHQIVRNLNGQKYLESINQWRLGRSRKMNDDIPTNIDGVTYHEGAEAKAS